MEHINQLMKWQGQADMASEGDAADMDVTKRLLKHSIEAVGKITRLRKIEAAAKNLLAVKGRHHTEQAYKALEAAIGEQHGT